MRITLNVTYIGNDDKSDSVLVVSDMLTAFANNKKSDALTVSIKPQTVYQGPREYPPDGEYLRKGNRAL